MHNTFAHGVASGDPTGEAVVIWTRLSGQAYPAEVGWEVALNPGFDRIAASGYTTATAERDWTVHVDVHGLRSATTYYYRFQAAGQQSPRGRTRTLGTGPIEHARFAFMSCAKFNAGHFNVYSRVAARDDIDFVLHLGDYIYEASILRLPRRRPALTSAVRSSLATSAEPWPTTASATRSTAAIPTSRRCTPRIR